MLTTQIFFVLLIAILRLSKVSWWNSASSHEKSNLATETTAIVTSPKLLTKIKIKNGGSSQSEVPDIPALRQADIISGERGLGPNVPTILVIDGKNVCAISSKFSQTLRAFSFLKKKTRFTNHAKFKLEVQKVGDR